MLGLTKHSLRLQHKKHMITVVVRQANSSDIEEVVQLFNQYRELQGKRSDIAAAREFLLARMAAREAIIFVAHERTVLMGFAQLYPSFSSVALARVFILNDLFVHEASRRKGVASRLLDAVESYAWSHDAARVTLNVARENNSGQYLYEVQGWHRDEQFFMYHQFPPAARSEA